MDPSPATALQNIGLAKQALAEARNITDVMQIRDAAVAAHAWATARGADEAAQMAMEVKLRSERKAGGFIIELKENGSIKRGNPQFVQDAPIINLANLGVKPDESKRWQRIASVPEEKFEELIQDVKNRTQSAILSIASQLERELNQEHVPGEVADIGNENFRVFFGDFRNRGEEIPDNSIHLIITDPPYGQEYLELWEPLGRLANRVLAPGGYLVTYSGQLYLPHVYNALCKHLHYYWTCSLKLQNRNLINGNNIYNVWKPLILFYKDPLHLPASYLNDFIEGTGREKDLHKWQQSEDEIDVFVEKLSPKNGTILDPMAGSGTTLASALRLGRKAIGIEIDPIYVKEMEKRLA